MNTQDLSDLRSALIARARAGQRPRDVLSSVQRRYPEATQPEVVREALHAAIDLAEGELSTAETLHRLAMDARLQ
jgi:hypothetical protein